MKPTHRTPQKENPGAGGRGPERQRGHAFMADKSKREWAEEALDGRERIAELEVMLRIIALRAAFEQSQPTGLYMTCLSLIERDARQALGENRE